MAIPTKDPYGLGFRSKAPTGEELRPDPASQIIKSSSDQFWDFLKLYSMQERADKTAAEGREWDKEQKEQQLKDAITLYDKKVADDRIDTAKAQTFTRDQNLLVRKDNIITMIAEVGAADPGLAFRMAERYSVNAEFSPFAEEFRTVMENWKTRSDKKDGRTKLITSVRSNLSPENLFKYPDETFQTALATKDEAGGYILSADDQLDLQKIRDNSMATLYKRADDPYTEYQKNSRAFIDDLNKVAQIRLAGKVAPEIEAYIPTVMESIKNRHEYIVQSGGMLPTFTDVTPVQLANRQSKADEIRATLSKNEGWDQMGAVDQKQAIHEAMQKESAGLSITDPAERKLHQENYSSMWGISLPNIQSAYERFTKQKDKGGEYQSKVTSDIIGFIGGQQPSPQTLSVKQRSWRELSAEEQKKLTDLFGTMPTAQRFTTPPQWWNSLSKTRQDSIFHGPKL